MSGNILWIHSICREQDDINLNIKQFYARLIVRGYQQNFLIPAFTRASLERAPLLKADPLVDVKQARKKRIKDKSSSN